MADKAISKRPVWKTAVLVSKALIKDMYEYSSRKYIGITGDYISGLVGAALGPCNPTFGGLVAFGVAQFISMDMVLRGAKEAVDRAEYMNCLGGSAEIMPLDMKYAGIYCDLNKKAYVNSDVVDIKNLSDVKRILAHEYAHMLFDLLPADKKKEIVADFVGSPNYASLRKMYPQLSEKNDVGFVNEMMAIHSAYRLNERYEAKRAITEQDVDAMFQVFLTIPVYYGAIQPIAKKYDHLGFDRPVTVAKAMRKEYMEKLLATV